MFKIEINHIINQVFNDTADIKTRESLPQALTIVDETQLKTQIIHLYKGGFTSK